MAKSSIEPPRQQYLAGHAITTTVRSVKEMGQIVGQIAAAWAERSAGVENVNIAMGHPPVRRGDPVTIIRNREPALLELPEALPVICPHSLSVGTIGKVGKNFSPQRKISHKPP